MRLILIVIGLFCCTFICKAQVKKVGTDTSLNYLNGSVVYVVDGRIARKEAIKPEDVYSKDILNGKQLDAIYGEKLLDTITVIVTKAGAIKYYQNKLSAFSREYESYLKSHDYKDDSIQYVVHNDPLDKPEVVNFLYKLPQEKIISVTFAEQPGLNGSATKRMVIIDTKVGE